MTGLRALAGRPIAERERRVAFWVTAAILACAAAVLLLLPGDETALAPPPEPAAQADGAAASRAARQAPAAPLARPLAAARRFLNGYLPFVYGHGTAQAIPATAPSLRDRLAASRLRVPPAASKRHPRVVGLDGRRLAAGGTLVTATIADGGPATYPISLTLARLNGRWLVVTEGTD